MLADYFSTYYLQLHYGTIFITANYFIAVMLPVLFAGPLRRPRAWAKLAGLILLSCAGMELCGAVLHALRGDANLQPFVGGVLLTAAAMAAARSRGRAARLAMGMGYIGMVFLTLGITMMVGNIRVEEDFDLQRALVLLNLVLILLLTLLLRRFSRFGDPALMLLVPLGAASAMSCVFGVNGLFEFLPLSRYTALAYSLVLLLILVVLYYSAFALPAWLQSSSQAQAERFLRQASENTLTVLREDLEHYNRVRHDMKNQYLYMKTLLDEGRYEELRAYWSDWSDQLMPPHMTLACENQTLAIILNMESAKARRAGVELDAQVLAPAQLQIADPDLCSLLVNLIDNAVEYLAADDAPARRTVEVEVRLVQQSLILSVRNPLRPGDEEKALRLTTSKAHPQEHGFGSRIVASLARKYGGAVYYQAEDGYFLVRVILVDAPAGKEQP